MGRAAVASLRFNAGPGGQMLIPVEVEYSEAIEASDHELWQAEYQREVLPVKFEPFDLLIDDKRHQRNGRRRRHDEDFADVFAGALEKPMAGTTTQPHGRRTSWGSTPGRILDERYEQL